MTKKQFEVIRILVVIILSITIGVSVLLKISFLPPLVIIIATGLIQFLYRQVREITADERDWKLAGRAAIITYWITALVLVIIGSSLLAYSATFSSVYRAGYWLLYIVSFMMTVNTFSFLILGQRGDK